MFSKDTYIHRRNNLKKEVKSGVALFLGNVDVAFNYPANQYHFRQDSHFLYFFGLQNQGFAGDALDLLIEYVQKKLTLKQLYCNIESSNKNSIKLFKKFGFVESGLKKDWNYFEGKWVDELFLQNIFGTK